MLTNLSLQLVDNGVLMIRMAEVLQQAVKDLADRPHVEKPRQLILRVILTPEVNQAADGTFYNYPKVDYEISTKLPSIIGSTTHGRLEDLETNPKLLINSDLPGVEPGQTTIFEEESGNA